MKKKLSNENNKKTSEKNIIDLVRLLVTIHISGDQITAEVSYHAVSLYSLREQMIALIIKNIFRHLNTVIEHDKV